MLRGGGAKHLLTAPVAQAPDGLFKPVRPHSAGDRNKAPLKYGPTCPHLLRRCPQKTDPDNTRCTHAP
jgi:hypothetical protein